MLKIIIVVNVVAFVLFQFVPIEPFYLTEDSTYQVITYSLIHGGLLHLSLNMLGLYVFGKMVCKEIGGITFLSLYLVSIIGSAVACLLFSSQFPVVGASGAVFGVMAAFGVLFAKQELILLFPPIPMKAIYLVISYAIVEVYFSITSSVGISHVAHVGGLASGLIFATIWKLTTSFR